MAAALAIAIFAAGAVSMVGAQDAEELVFTVDVHAFDVHLETIHDTDFEEMSPEDVTEMHSFDVANDGDMDAMMSANFLTEDGGINVSLNNNGDAREIDIVFSGEAKECHTKLSVPPGQPGADYLGSLELIFTPATRPQ
jgi:hypothetical protein